MSSGAKDLKKGGKRTSPARPKKRKKESVPITTRFGTQALKNDTPRGGKQDKAVDHKKKKAGKRGVFAASIKG